MGCSGGGVKIKGGVNLSVLYGKEKGGVRCICEFLYVSRIRYISGILKVIPRGFRKTNCCYDEA